jgi:triacylglycerol esterase/lipase EstA (alpha/beta hydrolase family)
LCAGAAGYVSWAKHLVADGAPAWWFVAGAPLAYLAPVMALVALWMLTAWIWRTPRPPEARLGMRGAMRLYIGEVLAVAASWPLMAFHRLLVRDPAPRPAARPVILVHGVLVNDGVWLPFRRRLAAAGFDSVYTLNYGPPYASIDRFAAQLARKIERVCAATGATAVTLVCHSMGGLVARTCLRDYGSARIAGIVTIGTPHHGSVLAWMYFGRCLAQMRPGNRWLAQLNRDEGEAPPVPLTSIWSRHDSMVAPQASCELRGADNVVLVGIGHNALLGDMRVTKLALGAISSTVCSPDRST